MASNVLYLDIKNFLVERISVVTCINVPFFFATL